MMQRISLSVVFMAAIWSLALFAPPASAFGKYIPGQNEETDNLNDDEADPDPDKNPCAGPSDEGDALHMRLTTGNIWTRVPIFESRAGDKSDLVCEIRYDTQRRNEDGPLSYGWTHSYNIYLIGNYSGQTLTSVTYVEGNGRRNNFPYNGSVFTKPKGRWLELTWSPPNTCSVTYPNGTTIAFDASQAPPGNI